MIDGASTVELAALGMVRMSEAEKYGWVNPGKTKEGDKPKAVMMPFIGDPSLQHGRPIESAAATQTSVPLDEGGGVLYSSSRGVERCIRPCVSPSAQDLVRMLLNNAHGSTVVVDIRWEDRQSFSEIEGPVHDIFNYKEHNLDKYDELKIPAGPLGFSI